jgi:xylose dehydrogenase (NAD/NADP)
VTHSSADSGSASNRRRAAGDEIGLGFIGAGGIVRHALAPAAHAATGVRLQAVAARDRQRAQALEPAGRSYDDYDALLADPSVDLVYVALDNGGHLPWTLAALAAGKHVICEKPLGLDPTAVDTMLAAADQHDRLLVEAFWYRWHPRTRRLEQLLGQGALGPVQQVQAGFSYSGPEQGDPDREYRYSPERGGGALLDVGCYALSAAHLALGPGLSVHSAAGRRGPTGVDLEVTATMVAPTGGSDSGPPTAAIHCGMAGVDRQLIAVTGQAARLQFGDPAFTALRTQVDLTITTPDRAVRREQFAPVDPYRLMIEAVAARIRGEDSFLPAPEHSRQVAASTAALFAAVRADPAAPGAKMT